MKKTLFFENARFLKEKLNITPLMYGSLGLEYVTRENLNADDIDILIPELFINERWEEFKEALAGEGYVLIDEHEHTFEKNHVCYSYASIEELETFTGIKVSDINEEKREDINFKILSIEQYLKVYTASSKDGYRINVRQKKDEEKLAIIRKYL